MRKRGALKPRRFLLIALAAILLIAIFMGMRFYRHLNRIPFFEGGSISFSCSPLVVEKELGEPDSIKQSEQNAISKELYYSNITIQGFPAEVSFRFINEKLNQFLIAVQISDEHEARTFEQNANHTIQNHASPFQFLVTGNPISPVGREWCIYGIGLFSVYNNEWEAYHERGDNSVIPCIIIEGELRRR